jgi:hypothetical protein
MVGVVQETPLQTGFSRVWLTVGGSSPGRTPVLLPLAKAGALRWPGAAGTKLEVPDPNQHNEFRVAATIAPARQYPTTGVVNRKGDRPSLLLALRKQQCPVTVQIHFGACGHPGDFDRGWETVMTVVEGAVATDYTSGDMGAYQSGDRGGIDETVTFEGEVAFDVGKIGFSSKAASESTKPYVAVVVCDAPTCAGLCGSGSDGCQAIFAVTAPLGGTPSASPGVTFTMDDFSTSGQTYVTALSSATPTGAACVGRNLVVICESRTSLAYADISDIFAEDEMWTEVATAGGFVAAHGPRAVYAYAPNQVFFVGAGGYIYSSSNIENGVAVDDEGDTTTEDLNAVHSPDGRVVLVGGDADVIMLSTDGGQSYSLLNPTGSGDDITTVLAFNASELLVGTSGHELYRSQNGGLTWTAVAFPGAGTGTRVAKLAMPPGQHTIMYMVDQGVSAQGRVLRSYSGGNSWVIAPEKETMSLPANASLADVAACADVNRVYAVGAATGGALGILLRGSPV